MSLLQRAETWTQQWMAVARTLKNQIRRRFGDGPEWAADRIDRADVDTLERWTYGFIDAAVLDDVFLEESGQ